MKIRPTEHRHRSSRPTTRRNASRARVVRGEQQWSKKANNVIDFNAARMERLRREETLSTQRSATLLENHERETQEMREREERRAQREAETAQRRSNRQNKQGKCPACHWGLLVSTLLLLLISVLVVYSSSMPIALDNHNGDSNHFLVRQLLFVGIGLAAFFGVSRLTPQQIRIMAWGLYAAALIGLFLTKFTPLGTDLGSGAKRWLRMGPFPQQCSEWAKIALIGVMADFWSRASQGAQKSYLPWAFAAVIALPVIGLTLLQPHLSASLLLLAIPLGLAFYADVPIKRLGRVLLVMGVFGGALLGIGSQVGLPGIQKYQVERITSHFLGHGNEGGQGMDYQVNQSRQALANGGVFGYGLGKSPSKHGYLPAPHTDFILAVVGEEFGLFGLLFLLSLYGAMIFFCFQVGHSATTSFEALLCAGVGSLLALQVVGNTCVVTGLMPVTGMPLPLISYGGSGLLFTLIGIGAVLGVSRNAGRQSETKTHQTSDGLLSTQDVRLSAVL